MFEEKLYEWCGTDNFELLYRGTRDGFGADDFHRLCDNKGKTLVIVKNTSGHVFGGFASISWESPSSWTNKKAPCSFIYTLTNMHGIQPTKFTLKDENDENAVYLDKSIGPLYGYNRSTYDVGVFSNCNSSACSYANFPVTYNDTTGKGNSIFSSNTSNNAFQVQEYEVFKIC